MNRAALAGITASLLWACAASSIPSVVPPSFVDPTIVSDSSTIASASVVVPPEPPSAPIDSAVNAEEKEEKSDEAQATATAKFVCAPPDQGWGNYLPYKKIHGAKVSLPKLTEPREIFDVYIHFHASDAVRRGFVHSGYPAVFVGFDLREGSSAYQRAFEHAAAFQRILTDVKALLAEHTGHKVRLGRIVLSSWSAGFGASTRILRQFPEQIHGLILLDSLYAPQRKDDRGNNLIGTVFPPALNAVLAFTKRALTGERSLFLSYSNVPTIGYASTGEVASYLTKRLGLHEHPQDPGEDPRGLRASLDQQGVHLRGLRGSDAKAHCQHLRLAAEATRLLFPSSDEAAGAK